MFLSILPMFYFLSRKISEIGSIIEKLCGINLVSKKCNNIPGVPFKITRIPFSTTRQHCNGENNLDR